MRFVTIDDVPGGSPGALLASGDIVHLMRAATPGTIEAWLPNSVAGILAAGHAGLATVAGIVSRCEQANGQGLLHQGMALPPGTRLLPPIPRPQLIVAAGLAYKSHLAEMSGTPTPPVPTGFMKSPTSLSAPDAMLKLPPQACQHVDFEGELAVVFGRTCYRVEEVHALDHVAGYTIANDLSARDWVEAVWRSTAPWEARQTWEVNIMGKQLPGFTALGPSLVTADEIGDPTTLRLTTTLNGSKMQDAPVSDLIFSIPQMISYFSQWYTFGPGDILITGTPAGVGVGRKPQIFLQSGDQVDVSIDRIGTLRTIIAS